MKVYRKVIKSISKYEKIFEYYDKSGKKINNSDVIEYIKSLKIPPNYLDVEIDLNKNAKIHATGYDNKNRRQYIYNKKFIEKNMRERICNMKHFGQALPKIINDVNHMLNEKGLTKNKIIATVINLIINCNFRIGNQLNEEKYNSYGISTITKKHVDIKGNNIKIDFIGKKGVRNVCQIQDRRISHIVKELLDEKTNKEHVFSYEEEGEKFDIKANDVNDFLRTYADITSKDFRTWYANIYFIDEIMKFKEIPEKISERKKNIKQAVEITSQRLHHTPAICKKKYIVVDILDLYVDHPLKFKKLIANNYKGHADKAFLAYLEHYC